RPRTELLPHRRDHLEIRCVVEADLQVEDFEAGLEALRDLGGETLLRATREIEEVRCLLLLKTTQKSPHRLAAGSTQNVPQGHIDSCPGKVSCAGAELPQAVRKHVATHSLPVPRI